MIGVLLHNQISPEKQKTQLFLLHHFQVLEDMREGKIFNHFDFLLILKIISFFPNEVISKGYIVRDDEEWNSQSNFLSCFQDVKGQHNMYEVEEETFRSCNASSGVLARYDSGNDRFKLTEGKKYWFLCNFRGHCHGGMRFSIDVKQSSTPSNTTDSTTVLPSSQPNELPAVPPTSSSRGILFSESWKTGIHVMAFEMFFKLI